jgi:hypothetical protein
MRWIPLKRLLLIQTEIALIAVLHGLEKKIEVQ